MVTDKGPKGLNPKGPKGPKGLNPNGHIGLNPLFAPLIYPISAPYFSPFTFNLSTTSALPSAKTTNALKTAKKGQNGHVLVKSWGRNITF